MDTELDEQLEGTGSGIEDDDEDFPTEWTVVDDAGDDMLSSSEDSSVTTKKVDSSDKKDKSSSSRHSKESANRKKDDGSSKSKRDDGSSKSKRDDKSSRSKKDDGSLKSKRDDGSSKSKKDSGSSRSNKDDGNSKSKRDEGRRTERSQASKSNGTHSHSRQKSVDRKSDSNSRSRRHDSRDRRSSRSQDKKADSSSRDKKHDSQDDKMSKESTSHSTSSKVAETNDVVQVDGSTKVKLEDNEKGKNKETLKPKETEEKDEPLPSGYPLPSISTDLVLFTGYKQSTRCRLVTGGAENPPEVIPYHPTSNTPGRKMIKWGMRIYPIFWADLTQIEMTKVFNICAHIGIFFFQFPKNPPKHGDISLMLHHPNHVKDIFLKLTEMTMTAPECNIFVNRRKDDGTFETAEVKFLHKINQDLNPIPRKDRSTVEGKEENRTIKVQNIPEGTSKEMVQVMFPLSEVAEITFSGSSRGEVTGTTIVKFRNPGFVKQVMTCYEHMKIGSNKLTLTFTGKLIDTEKDTAKKDTAKKDTVKKDTVKKVTGETDTKNPVKKSRFDSRGPVHSSYHSTNKNSNRGNPERDISRLRQQRWEMERRALVLKQQNLMVVQQVQDKAILATNMMASGGVSGILGPPPIPMNFVLPALPEGLSLGEKQHLMVIEQQKLKLLKQNMQMQQISDNALSQIQQPLRNKSELDLEDEFVRRVDGNRGDVGQSRQGKEERDVWREERNMNLPPGDREADDRDRFDHKDRLYSDQQRQSSFQMPPERVQNAEDVYGLQREKQNEELEWDRIDRRQSDQDVLYEDRMRETDRLSPKWTNRDRSMPRRDLQDRDMPLRDRSSGDFPDRDMPLRDRSSGDFPDRDMPLRDRSDRDFSDHDMPLRDRSGRDFPDHDMQLRDRSGRDLPDRDLPVIDYVSRDSDRIQQRGVQESDFQQQMHEFSEPSYSGVDKGSAMYGKVENRHGGVSLKRRFESEEAVSAKRLMSGSSSSSTGFIQGDGGITRQPGLFQPQLQPLVQVSGQMSSAMPTFPVQQPPPATMAGFPMQKPSATMATFPVQQTSATMAALVQQQMSAPMVAFPVQQPSATMATFPMQQPSASRRTFPVQQQQMSTPLTAFPIQQPPAAMATLPVQPYLEKMPNTETQRASKPPRPPHQLLQKEQQQQQWQKNQQQQQQQQKPQQMFKPTKKQNKYQQQQKQQKLKQQQKVQQEQQEQQQQLKLLHQLMQKQLIQESGRFSQQSNNR
ncbi:uncharacterized protein LOC121378336 isoform X2 [Gigantopelta aegis]|uniref:uncharacterized protein LOC121378336 isoform X2 n=1 Tax=Gigantopelta aegis TaxID=1735272 RepID=UPI001B88BA72|nr:uncharacterized protein LOC121378336 isoform X2 [Gigantopelta aegis]